MDGWFKTGRSAIFEALVDVCNTIDADLSTGIFSNSFRITMI